MENGVVIYSSDCTTYRWPFHSDAMAMFRFHAPRPMESHAVMQRCVTISTIPRMTCTNPNEPSALTNSLRPTVRPAGRPACRARGAGGDPCWDRTSDSLLKRQVLYR